MNSQVHQGAVAVTELAAEVAKGVSKLSGGERGASTHASQDRPAAWTELWRKNAAKDATKLETFPRIGPEFRL